MAAVASEITSATNWTSSKRQWPLSSFFAESLSKATSGQKPFWWPGKSMRTSEKTLAFLPNLSSMAHKNMRMICQ